MSRPNDVVIIGGGPAGITAALLLKQTNHLTPVVYEATLQTETYGGAIGIPPNGLRLLGQLGLFDEVATLGSSATNVVLHSVKGSVLGEADILSWTRNKTGYGLLKIMRSDLMEVLLKAANKAGIYVQYGKQLAGIKETTDSVIAAFTDGTSVSGDILLGCDGVNSAVRNTYVDPGAVPRYTGISDYYSLVPMSDRPTIPGSLHALHATFTTSGMFALMHCRKSNDMNYWFFSYSVPGPETDEGSGGEWDELKQSHIESFNPRLQGLLAEVGGEWGEMIRDFVAKSKDVGFHPIFNLPIGRPWYKGRCLLLGDAAHAMSPHLSQGVSQVLEDVFMLSRLLSASSSPVAEKVFKAYDRNRRPRVEELSAKAKSQGSGRKQTAGWRLWLNELGATVALGLYNILGLDKLGLGQGFMAYNVEEVELLREE
ncbi:FAD binding domain protein [Cadophora sp. MPI-SDFR-AT-0126]|nr:FAD binding domain protein [Leotiomycetes sp. MPI-SDFR-AT-0126]